MLDAGFAERARRMADAYTAGTYLGSSAIDMSLWDKVIFICTANYLEAIPGPLRDRILAFLEDDFGLEGFRENIEVLEMCDLDACVRAVTEAEWKAVQQVWDYLETYRPLIAARERRLYGKEPAWVDPQPRTDLLDG